MSPRLKDLLSLPAAERAEIAAALLDSLEDAAAHETIEIAWIEAARERLASPGETFDAEGHLAELESRYG